MKVGDDNLGFSKLWHEVGRNYVELPIVIVRVVGHQDAQTVADGDAGRDYEESIGEAGILRIGQFVQGLPRDEHRHDDRLAAARRHFASDAIKERVGVGVRRVECVFNPGVALLLRHLGQIDESFEGFDLAEEKAALTVGTGPVLEKLRRRSRDAKMFVLVPLLYPAANLVDELVRLNSVLRPLGLEIELVFAFLARRGNGNEVGALAPGFDDLIGDPFIGKPEMPFRFLEWRVNDRIFDDNLAHIIVPAFRGQLAWAPR